ncbi:MAG: ribulose-phosphate 3-epimerase [Marinilabiliales bacterium]|nr:MAG: ribulose-phosphate 3-epimerase [Marinilabiliales bacterium]
MSNPLIAPSFLSADFANLQRDCEMINRSSADWFHLDIMDGAFVPNISFGIPVVAAIKKHARKPLDVHLMIENPDKYLDDFAKAGADWISVHYETCPHLNRTIAAIKALNVKAGVVLNPHTPVAFLEEIITELDYLLLMSVNPGFGGQSFISSTIDKVARARKMIDEKGLKCIIQVDGGVTDKNAGDLIKAGADCLVAGSFIFKAENPVSVIENLKKTI